VFNLRHGVTVVFFIPRSSIILFYFAAVSPPAPMPFGGPFSSSDNNAAGGNDEKSGGISCDLVQLSATGNFFDTAEFFGLMSPGSTQPERDI
jgi:hypothetical protein